MDEIDWPLIASALGDGRRLRLRPAARRLLPDAGDLERRPRAATPPSCARTSLALLVAMVGVQVILSARARRDPAAPAPLAVQPRGRRSLRRGHDPLRRAARAARGIAWARAPSAPGSSCSGSPSAPPPSPSGALDPLRRALQRPVITTERRRAAHARHRHRALAVDRDRRPRRRGRPLDVAGARRGRRPREVAVAGDGRRRRRR